MASRWQNIISFLIGVLTSTIFPWLLNPVDPHSESTWSWLIEPTISILWFFIGIIVFLVVRWLLGHITRKPLSKEEVIQSKLEKINAIGRNGVKFGGGAYYFIADYCKVDNQHEVKEYQPIDLSFECPDGYAGRSGFCQNNFCPNRKSELLICQKWTESYKHSRKYVQELAYDKE